MSKVEDYKIVPMKGLVELIHMCPKSVGLFHLQ
jgi:hypothetical protein